MKDEIRLEFNAVTSRAKKNGLYLIFAYFNFGVEAKFIYGLQFFESDYGKQNTYEPFGRSTWKNVNFS